MNGVKSALASKGVWGGLIVLITWALGAWGYTLTETDQQALITVLMALGSGVGALLAIYGRIKASKLISK